MENKEYYLTESGLEELKKELDYLKVTKRPEVIQALKEARALGDLSENAEYDAARAEQAEVEGRIAQLEVMIEKAVIIEQNDTDKVSIGTTVTIKYLDEDDTSLDVVRHPMQIVKIKLDKEVFNSDLIRLKH